MLSRLKRAIIADDAPQVRTLIKILLCQFGVREVVEVEDGASAMAALRSGGADIVVMDWMMPVMDGIECIRRIRAGQDGIDPGIPIIMATGVLGDSAEATAMAAGASCFVRKPFSIRTFHNALLKVRGEAT